MNLLKKISLLLVILSSATSYAANDVEFENTWSPEAPPVAKVMAGYMKIINNSIKDVHIISAKSPLFKTVEIHLSAMKNGMMRMTQQKNLLVEAKSQIELKPGGLHMMLMGKSNVLAQGSVIPVSVTFDNGTTINIKLEVKASDAETSHQHQHHH